MPRHRARTAKSFSKSSRSNTPPSGSEPGAALARAASGARVVVGTISRAHGVRGAMVLSAPPTACQALRAAMDVTLEPTDEAGSPVHTRIERMSSHRTGALVQLEGIVDRDAAQGCVGRSLSIARAALPQPHDREYYACDILGASVYSSDGEKLGTIVEVIPTGANDVWVVRDNARELLVPAVSHAVAGVDLAARRVVVNTSALEAAEPEDGER